MLPRHLLVFGLLPHVVAHGDEKIAHAVSGIRHMSYERPAKGELRPAPSSATFPGCVEKLISVPTPLSTGANPRPISVERVPIARARLRARGLLRQASRNRMLVVVVRSMVRCTSSRRTISKSG